MNRPNILHIFVDQQRFDTIGALGNSVIRTPHLDALAQSGIAFTSAYTPSPVCVSARCSMLHGQYPMNTNCYGNGLMPTDGRETIMDALSRVGYRTHGIGKCHFTPDPHAMKGFDSRVFMEEIRDVDSIDKLPYFEMLVENGYGHVNEPHGIRGEMYYTPQISQLPQRLHPTQFVADRAIDYVNEDHNGKSWYLYAGIIAPHPPFSPPVPWNRLYRSFQMTMPNLPHEYEHLREFVNLCQNRYKYRDQGMDAHAVRNIKAYYYACISFIDYQVGRMVQALKDTGQYENTLILFTGDHGDLLGDMDSYGKRSMHDGSCRIPMLASLPGVLEGGRICNTPVSLVDVAPTFLSLAGTTFETHQTDGSPLHELPINRPIYSAHSFATENLVMDSAEVPYPDDPELYRGSMTTYMILNERWKYFYSMADQKHFLFDRVTDPRETVNKAYIKCYRKDRDTMQKTLMETLRKAEDTICLDGNSWRKTHRYELHPDPNAGLLTQDADLPWVSSVIEGYNT